MDTKCRPGPVAFRGNALAIFLEKFDDTCGCAERLIGGIGDAGQEEFELCFPGTVLAHFL